MRFSACRAFYSAFFPRAVLPRAGVALDSTYMGRPHCAQVFPVALAAGDAPVRDMALSALVAGDTVGQDLPHDGASRLLQGSGDCAPPGSNAGRSLSRNGRPRSDVAWHCPLVSWWPARPHCAIKRTKRLRLTFPVTGADSLRGQGNCQGDSLLYL